MLKLIAQNKYKLMAFIVVLYLLVDVMQHKGQARVLLSKKFPELNTKGLKPTGKNQLHNKNKNWKKGINTVEKLDDLNAETPGFECDVYFDTATKVFYVHHDAGKNSGPDLNLLLEQYQQKKLKAGIWLDIKNLDTHNWEPVLNTLLQLQKKFRLQNKIIVESGRADLLSAFTDSGFFSSWYVPFFNPYKMNDTENSQRADSISSVISKTRVDALSGYYFQTSFLHYYFPRYPVLTWGDKSEFSIVNLLFQRKTAADSSIFIVLKP
ncbi:MAG: hypothetical protein JNM14_11765 [Ferruginibacter sp.]|nr:hypothetical protein [Ferruginibacter sp.]